MAAPRAWTGGSWGAHEPRGGGFGRDGGHGGNFNGNGSRPHRGNNFPSSTQRRQSDQDAIWAAYDRVHGADHPNNAGTAMARGRTNNDGRQNGSQNGSRNQGSYPQSHGQWRGMAGNDSHRNVRSNGDYSGSGGGKDSRHVNGGNGQGSSGYGRVGNNNNYGNDSHPSGYSSNGSNNRAARPNATSSGCNGNRNQQHQSYNPQPHTQHQPRNAPSTYNNSSGNGNKLQLQVLYTHQKTKKKKSWKDGRLVLAGASASLFDACPLAGNGGGAIDTLELNRNEAQMLRDGIYGDDFLESEKFLVQVEGPWVDPSGAGAGNDILWNKRPQSATVNGGGAQRGGRGRGVRPSAGMQKLLSRKFQMPNKVRPMHPEEKRRRAWEGNTVNKRQRPLQPGELERQFYGGGGGGGGYGNDGAGYDNGGGGYSNDRGGYGNDDGGYGNGGYADEGGYNGGRGFDGAGRTAGGHRGEERGLNFGRQPPLCDGRRSNDQNDGEGPRNPYNGGSQNQRDGPQRDQHPPRRPMFRGNGPSGGRADAGRSGQPSQFQPNEYDPRGFYEEEESDDDDDMLDEGGDDVGHGERQERGMARLSDRGEDVAGAPQQQRREVRFQDEDARRPGDSFESSAARTTLNDCPPQGQACSREMGEGHSRADQDATDELFALLGATTAPAPPQESPATRPNDEARTDGDERQTNDSGNDAGQNDEDDEEEEGSLLAGIRRAEEEREHNRARSDSPLAFGVGSSSWDDDDEDFGEDANDGIDEGRDDEAGESGQTDTGGNEAASGSGGGCSGFTLPSAGESSSEEEEDSDAG